MKNKLTQTEKNMIENQKQIIDAFEKSGNADRLRSFAEIWTPEKIKEHVKLLKGGYYDKKYGLCYPIVEIKYLREYFQITV